MGRVSVVCVLFLFSLTSPSHGRIIFETPSHSSDDKFELFLPSDLRMIYKIPSDTLDDEVDLGSLSDVDSYAEHEPPAWLDRLFVEGGQLSPDFTSRTLQYTLTLSPGVTKIKIIAQVSPTKAHEKYKVITKPRVVDPELLKSPPSSNGSTSTTIVEVHVSAEDHQSVTYYLEVAVQGRRKLWSVLLQILFWTGVVVAVAVLAIFAYSMYLAVSRGGVTGEGIRGYFSRRPGGDYRAA